MALKQRRSYKVEAYKCPYCGTLYERFKEFVSCMKACGKEISACKIKVGDTITIRKKHIKFFPLQHDLFIRFKFMVKAVKTQHGMAGPQIVFVYENEKGEDAVVHFLHIAEKIH